MPYARRLLVISFLGTLFGCSSSDTSEGGESGDAAIVDEGPLQYAPIVEYDRFDFEGFPVIMYIPPDPVGLVWLFHGSDGTVGYANKIETVATTNELLVEGIGFVATESTEQGADNQWNDDTTDLQANEDLARLFNLRDYIIETTEITEETPTFAIGFSNGGGMSGNFARAGLEHGWPVRATGPHLSGGNAWGLDIPIIWVIGVNDANNNQSVAEDEAAARDAQGHTTEIHYCPEQLITPDYFTKNPSVSLSRSEKTQSEMVRLELIDETGKRIAPDDELENYIHLFEQEAEVSSPTLRSEEIRVAWAMHRMNAYYAREVRDFFVDAL